MINKRIETFLEHTNMNYMFCLLSDLEVLRLNSLPPYVKQKFNSKITELAMDHVSLNEIPDYMMDIEEARLEMERLGLTPEEYETGAWSEDFEDEGEFESEILEEDHKDNGFDGSDDNFEDDADDEDFNDNDED